MHRNKIISAAAVFCLLFVVSTFVFPQQEETKKGALSVDRLPLPGETALEFELTAVVGKEIKKIELSDFRGKCVYLTFIPAAFTFV